MSPTPSRRWSREQDQSLHRTVLSDLRGTRFGRDYLQEFRRLYDFYLDDERRAELESKGRIRRAFLLLGWLLKSLLLKLSPARRLLLFVSLLCVVMGPTAMWAPAIGSHEADFRPLGYLIVLFILALELRDKLLARDEIEVARQVQLALLPRVHPEIPGWTVWSCSRPANDVGGDLVDYIPLDGFRHGILLGDVAGKGLGAALLSAKLQATLRALLPDFDALDDLGRRANAIFHRDGLDNRYATLFLAEIEHDSGCVRYLNAGHNPPIWIRHDGTTLLPASSVPLGMLPDARYEEGRLELAAGDLIVAYSDGLSEATDPAGDEFGVDRLETLLRDARELPPERIGERILEAADLFLAGARAGDDLSLVILKRNT